MSDEDMEFVTGFSRVLAESIKNERQPCSRRTKDLFLNLSLTGKFEL